MLPMLLTLVVIAVGLIALLWTGTLLAQGYFYDSATDGLKWRAPAAAGALAAFFALWAFIDYRAPNVTDTIFSFSDDYSFDVDKLISVRKPDVGDEQETVYTRRTQSSGSRAEFFDDKGERWSRSKSGMVVALIIEEKKGDEVVRTRFNAETKDGKFAPRETRGIEQSLRYVEENGSRYILESNLGRVTMYRKSRLFYNIILNGLHFALWFVVLWLLLRFNWMHALGFAFVCWLVFTLVALPYLFSTSRAAAEKQAKPPAAHRSGVASLAIPNLGKQ